MNLAVAFDENYLVGAIGTVASVRLALGRDEVLNVVCLHSGVSEESQKLFSKSVSKIRGRTEVSFHEIKDDFKGFPAFRNSSKMTYARFMLPSICNGLRWVYLDVDILVCKSLKALTECELASTGLGAVAEKSIPNMGCEISGPVPFERNLAEPYFNAGVLALDMPKVTGSGLFSRACRLLAEFPGSCRYHDQSALNYIANGDYTQLDASYNTKHCGVDFEPKRCIGELKERSVNVHFLTDNKPWTKFSPNPAETMFRILLDEVFPGWKTAEFLKQEKEWRARMLFARPLKHFFKLRSKWRDDGGMEGDENAACHWNVIHAHLLPWRNPELRSLYWGWRSQIRQGSRF